MPVTIPDVVAVVEHGLDPAHLCEVIPVPDAADVDHDPLAAVREVRGERPVEVGLVGALTEVPDRTAIRSDKLGLNRDFSEVDT